MDPEGVEAHYEVLLAERLTGIAGLGILNLRRLPYLSSTRLDICKPYHTQEARRHEWLKGSNSVRPIRWTGSAEPSWRQGRVKDSGKAERALWTWVVVVAVLGIMWTSAHVFKAAARR